MKPRQRLAITLAGAVAFVTVIFLVVNGAFIPATPCLFACPVPKIIQFGSFSLYSGPLPTNPTCQIMNSAYATMTFTNDGPSANISRISLTGTSLTTTIKEYYLRGATCSQISLSNQPGVAGGASSNLTVFFGGQTASTLPSNQTFNLVINFTNGQSVSGQPSAR